MNQHLSFSSRLRLVRAHLSRSQAAFITGRKARSIRNWEDGISSPDPLIQADVLKKLWDYHADWKRG